VHHAYDRPVRRLVLLPVRPTASGAPVRLLSVPGDCRMLSATPIGSFRCPWPARSAARSGNAIMAGVAHLDYGR
jgi:hypothetical protein